MVGTKSRDLQFSTGRRVLLASLFLFGALGLTILGSENQLKTAAIGRTSGASPSTSFNMPILGYVFDSSKGALRPLFGIPGSASLGKALDLKIKLSRAWISPGQDYALAESSDPDSRGLLLVRLENGLNSIEAIPGIPQGADLVALSPTGSAAALYFREGKKVALLENLPNFNSQLKTNPSAGPSPSSLNLKQSYAAVGSGVPAFQEGPSSQVRQINVPQLPDVVESLGVSDDATVVLLGCSESENGAIYLLSLGGELRIVSLVGRAAAMAFLARSRSALVADPKNNEVFLLRDVTGAATRTTLVSREQGISEPVTVEASEDNERIFIVNSGGKEILVLELESGVIRRISAPSSTLTLSRLKGDGVFRLTDFFGNLLWLLDGGQTEPRVVFVPYASPSGPFISGLPAPDRGSPRRIRVRDVKH